jgi:hypothetical protein
MKHDRLVFLRERVAQIKRRGHVRSDELPLLVAWLEEALAAVTPAPVQGQLFAQQREVA